MIWVQRHGNAHLASMVQDDGTGLERWVFTPVPGGYTIAAAGGRTACSQLLGSTSCNATASQADAVSMYPQVGHHLIEEPGNLRVDTDAAALVCEPGSTFLPLLCTCRQAAARAGC